MLTHPDMLRYSRQILLPELNVEGQEKLLRGSVLVIGAGGLSSPVLFYLAAAGVGRIGIVDQDTVEESNLQRQILFRQQDIGKPKAALASQRIMELNPSIQVQTYACRITSENALEILSSYDVIVDGSDNLPTRYLVNDAAVLLGKCLIYGAIFQFEGQVSVFNQLQADGTRGPNYRDLFPEPPPPEWVPSCSESGVIGVLPGIIGSMQANEAIKVLAEMGTTLSGRLLIFDSLEFSSRFVRLQPRPDNPVSGTKPTLLKLIDYEVFCQTEEKNSHTREISASEVKLWLDSGKRFQFIDVREPLEYATSNIGGLNIPLQTIQVSTHLLNKDLPLVVHCQSGQRSKKATQQLKELGFTQAINMKGGLVQWKKEVDKGFEF